MINQVVILVGGLGTRLGSLTKRTPKALIKINNIPFLNYLIKYYSNFGIRKIVLLTKYKDYIFRKKYNNKIFWTSKIRCIREKDFLGTAGSLKNAIKNLDKKFIFCNGDTYFDINLLDFINKFKNNYVGILACSKTQPFDKRYTYFNNKKKLSSSGIYIFNRDKIKKYLINYGSLENKVISKIPMKKFKMISYGKRFIDIGTTKDLNRAKKFLSNTLKKKCAFFDRDGVINYDYGYIYKKKNFKFKKNVIKTIKFLNDKGYYNIVISNQSGVGRGYYTEKDVNILHKWINKKLNLKGAYIDKFYYAPYYAYSKKMIYRKGKNNRKPNIGLFKKAFNDFHIEKRGSFFVGDKKTDEIAAKKFKLKYFNVNNKTDLYNLLKKKIRF